MDFIDEAASKLRIDAEIPPAPLKAQDDQVRRLADQKQAAAERSDYERAAELRTERLQLQAEYDAGKQELLGGEPMDRVVDEMDIANLISTFTGIPTGR